MEQSIIQGNRDESKVADRVTFEKPYVIKVTNLPSKMTSQIHVVQQYLPSVIIVGLCLMGIYAIMTRLVNYDFAYSSILGLGILMFFAGTLYFLIQPKKVVTVEKTILRDIAYPILKERAKPVFVYVDKPVQVEKIVEKPIIQYVDRPVERIVEKVVERSRKKLDIPQYLFVGSVQTRRYHKRSCRLSKLIKKKYKLSSNDEDMFKNRKFKTCKICLK